MTCEEAYPRCFNPSGYGIVTAPGEVWHLAEVVYTGGQGFLEGGRFGREISEILREMFLVGSSRLVEPAESPSPTAADEERVAREAEADTTFWRCDFCNFKNPCSMETCGTCHQPKLMR